MMPDDVIRQFTPEQCEAGRAAIAAELAKDIGAAFAAHPGIKSAVLFVGQFWADEALDAVHHALAFSIYDQPDLAAYKAEAERLYRMVFDATVDLDDLDSGFGRHDLWVEGLSAEMQLTGRAWTYDELCDFQERFVSFRSWDSNGEAIPLFAAFCPEDADQEQPTGLSHAPYCIFRRGASGVETEIIGVKVRPWLEGVAPQGFED